MKGRSIWLGCLFNDVVPALYQVKVISNIWAVESILALIAIASFVFIRPMSEKFH